MPKPLLPPRGVFSPTTIVYDKSLSPSVRDTYHMLKGLAWGGKETPPLSLEQLEDITGKARATIYGHMRELDTRGALRWRSAGDATLIISFIDPADLVDPEELIESRNLDLLDDDSFKESLNHHPPLQSRNLDKIQKSGLPVQKIGQPVQEAGQRPEDALQGSPGTMIDVGFGELVKLWKSIRGPITAFDADEIAALMDEWRAHADSMPAGHPNKAISAQSALEAALRATALQANRPNLKYARSVLVTYMREGIPVEGVKPDETAAQPQEQIPEEDPTVYAPMPEAAKKALEKLLNGKQEKSYATN